jgi:hypothetical protein
LLGSHADQPAATAASAADAVKVARELRAAPTTPPEPVQILELVTQIAAMVRDQRTETADLRADVQRTFAGTAAKLSDFERRLALAEARSAVASAADAGKLAPGLASAAATAKTGPPKAPVVLTCADAALAAAPSGAPSAIASRPPRPVLRCWLRSIVAAATAPSSRCRSATPSRAMGV